MISIEISLVEGKAQEDIWWTPEWKRKWRKIFRKQFADYSSVTTLHGVIYIGEEGRHWFER